MAEGDRRPGSEAVTTGASSDRPLEVAILETGVPPPELAGEFGSYSDMLAALLAGNGRRFRAYDVTAGDFPSAGSFSALLITGSPAGVYDPLPWIEPLKAFLRSSAGTPMIGVCFGHQIMAAAFGGRVEKSAKGWGLGLHRYDIVSSEDWMGGAVGAFSIPASHQDQVLVAPAGSRVVASSAFTPFAALAYSSHPAISFQGHPEFSPAFAQALLRSRRGSVFEEAHADAAIASLGGPDSRDQVGRWMVQFLEARTGSRSPEGGSQAG